jgi:excisionase family DNA binding protein
VIVLDLAPIAGHLRRALAAHWAWCRANGFPWPAELDELGRLLSRDASNGQEATTLGDRSDLADTALMPPVLLLDLDEVARRLSVSRRTVERLAETGELPTVKIGASRRVHVEALADFAAALHPDVEVRTLPGPEVTR